MNTMVSMEIKPRQFEIIEAAGEIITKYGVNGLTTKNIAAKMGFGESALYRHFKSKEDIILMMLSYLAENMNERLSVCLQSESDPISRLNAFFDSQFDFFTAKPHFLVAVFSDGLVEENNAISNAINRVMATSRTYLTQVISQGQQQGVLKADFPVDFFVHVAMGSFRLHMLQWRLSGFSFNLKEKGEMLVLNLITLIRYE